VLRTKEDIVDGLLVLRYDDEYSSVLVRFTTDDGQDMLAHLSPFGELYIVGFELLEKAIERMNSRGYKIGGITKGEYSGCAYNELPSKSDVKKKYDKGTPPTIFIGEIQ
jgi:hypothetical protein